MNGDNLNEIDIGIFDKILRPNGSPQPVDWYIAHFTEDEIEATEYPAMLWDFAATLTDDIIEDEPAGWCSGGIRAEALNRIDQLQLAGTYEQERERLKDLYRQAINPIGAATAMRAIEVAINERRIEAEGFENFMQGLESSDPDQRARFQKLWPILEKMTPEDAAIVLACLELAKKQAGRHQGQTLDDSVAILEMKRLHLREGKSIPEAAKQAVSLAGGGGATASKEKRLENAFRKKMKLRIPVF